MRITTVILTGADNGIGFNMTRYLLADGCCVAALDLTDENLGTLLIDYPDRLLVLRCDVADETQVKRAVETTHRLWGRIDILVNNAALAVFSPFEEKTLSDTRREFEVNFFGALHLIAAVLPVMKAQRSGIIHNVSSGVGITGFPGIHGYASTKGAIESLTRTLALEFAPYGITVNLMHPPLTNTRSAAPLGIPAQAMADPEQVGRNLARQIRSTKPIILERKVIW
jgi:NAD(P)-dependent dehydrogenase (short-subunit alcohol dehydrogenase family)